MHASRGRCGGGRVGQTFFYFGNDIDAFAALFEPIGIVIPFHDRLPLAILNQRVCDLFEASLPYVLESTPAGERAALERRVRHGASSKCVLLRQCPEGGLGGKAIQGLEISRCPRRGNRKLGHLWSALARPVRLGAPRHRPGDLAGIAVAAVRLWRNVPWSRRLLCRRLCAMNAPPAMAMRNYAEDEGRPLEAGCQEQASNHRKLHRSKADGTFVTASS